MERIDPYLVEIENVTKERDEALDTIDDMVDVIGKVNDMSKSNKASVAAEKTVESLRKLSAKAYNNYTESSDRYYLGKTQAYTVAADLLETNMAAETMGEATELNEALDTIDDMVDVVSKQIIKIAYDNRDFICSRCLSTAYALFGLMEKYAREEDTEDIRSEWKEITGRDIKEWG